MMLHITKCQGVTAAIKDKGTYQTSFCQPTDDTRNLQVYLIIRYFDLRYDTHRTTKENDDNKGINKIKTLTTKSISLHEIYRLYATTIDPIAAIHISILFGEFPTIFIKRRVYPQMGRGFKTYALTIRQKMV